LMYQEEKGVKTKKIRVVIGPVNTSPKEKLIRIELLRFGFNAPAKNYSGKGAADKSYYSFLFFITPHCEQYANSLELIEWIADFFERKPFLQIKIEQKEYELGISPEELSFETLNQFWRVQQHPHQPVLFYQTRISEV
jgi:hypothetical protein